MGVLRPTKLTGDLIIYSKWCLQCDYPEELLTINQWAMRRDLDTQIIRTAYRPADHQKAARLWAESQKLTTEAAQDYPAFVVDRSSKPTRIIGLKELCEMITQDTTEYELKNKLVKEGKIKGDLQNVSRPKRSPRKNRMGNPSAPAPLANGVRSADSQQEI